MFLGSKLLISDWSCSTIVKLRLCWLFSQTQPTWPIVPSSSFFFFFFEFFLLVSFFYSPWVLSLSFFPSFFLKHNQLCTRWLRQGDPLSLVSLFFSWRVVGDGYRVRFWHDTWCGDHAQKELFPELYSITIDKMYLYILVSNNQLEERAHHGTLDLFISSMIGSWS